MSSLGGGGRRSKGLCHGRGARSVRIPCVNGIITLGGEGADVPQVHLETIGLPTERLLYELRRFAGDVKLDAGAHTKGVGRVALELGWVGDGVGSASPVAKVLGDRVGGDHCDGPAVAVDSEWEVLVSRLGAQELPAAANVEGSDDRADVGVSGVGVVGDPLAVVLVLLLPPAHVEGGDVGEKGTRGAGNAAAVGAIPAEVTVDLRVGFAGVVEEEDTARLLGFLGPFALAKASGEAQGTPVAHGGGGAQEDSESG